METEESIFKFDGETYVKTVRAAAKVNAARVALVMVLRESGQLTEGEALRWMDEAFSEYTELISQAYFNAAHS